MFTATLSGQVYAQSTITTSTDNFDRADSASVGGSWTEGGGADGTITSNQLRFNTGGSNDVEYAQQGHNLSSSTLSLNPSTISWSFNMRQNQSDPSGLAVGSIGIGFVLAADNTNLETTGNGYAVVLGQTGITDPVRLVRYTSGLDGPLTDVIAASGTGADIGSEFLNIRVTYAPSTNTWNLFGTTGVSFSDPSNVSDAWGTAVDSTHTGSALATYGALYAHPSAGTAIFDNFAVRQNLNASHLWAASRTIASAEMSGSSDWSVNSGITLTMTGGITEATAGLGFTKSGSGTMVIQGSSGYTGSTIVRGGILSLEVAGALTDTSSIVVETGGTLRVNNVSGTVSDLRLADDVTVTLNGATFEYFGARGTASNRSDEAITQILVQSGASTLSLAGSAAVGGGGGASDASLALTHGTAGIARNPGATLRFGTDNEANVVVDNQPLVNGIVGGWMLWDDDDFATVDGSDLLVAVTTYGTNVNTATSTTNISLDNTSFTTTASRHINSLIMHNDAPVTGTIASGHTLTIESGGIILNADDADSPKTIAGPGNLTAGLLGGYELIVHTTEDTSAPSHLISAVIVNNGANSVRFTKGGVHSLTLSGNNTYTGETSIAQGTLILSSTGSIGSSNKIVVHRGATFNVSAVSGGFTLGNAADQTLGGNGSVVGGVTAGAQDSTISPGNSVGQLTFTGAGAITLNTNATVEIGLGGSNGSIGTAGTHYDQIVLDGATKVFSPGSATLKLVTLSGVVYGQAYTIVSAPGNDIDGTFFKTFAGSPVLMNNEALTYTQSDGVKYNINYSGSSITVTLVPEPSSIGLLALGGAALLRRRRRN